MKKSMKKSVQKPQMDKYVQKWNKLDNMKKALAGALVVMVIALGGYGFYWYSGVVKTREVAQQALRNSADLQDLSAKYDALQVTYNDLQGKYTSLEGDVTAELQRCRDFIGQTEGNFATFEYCKGFVNWADGLEMMQVSQ